MSDLELSLKEIDSIANKIRSKTLRRLALLYRESVVLMPVFIEKYQDIVERKKNYPPIQTIMRTLDCSQRTAYDYYNMIKFLDKGRSIKNKVDQKMFTSLPEEGEIVRSEGRVKVKKQRRRRKKISFSVIHHSDEGIMHRAISSQDASTPEQAIQTYMSFEKTAGGPLYFQVETFEDDKKTTSYHKVQSGVLISLTPEEFHSELAREEKPSETAEDTTIDRIRKAFYTDGIDFDGVGYPAIYDSVKESGLLTHPIDSFGTLTLETSDFEEILRDMNLKNIEEKLEDLRMQGYIKFEHDKFKGRNYYVNLFNPDRTGEWLTMTDEDIQSELKNYTVKRMKEVAAEILKTGDRRIKNRQKMIERILKRMKEYRSRFEYGATREEVERKIDEQEFLTTLRTAYNKLIVSSPVAPYVQVRLVRSLACGDLGIDRELFDSMLVSMAAEDPYTIQLSVGTGKAGNGVPCQRGECHFIIVKEQKKEGITEEDIKRAYLKVKQEETRFSDLIPFNYLKKELQEFDEDEINQKLLELERERIIDLQVAYDATQLEEPAYGIELSSRGLVYFIRWR